MKRILLHYANASPPSCYRQDFYAIKRRLLERHATPDGEDVQHIVKKCYGRDWDEGCTHDARCKCGGTGIFDERWITLKRWRWGRYVFHSPLDGFVMPGKVPCRVIEGYVRHANYGRASGEALLWLYLLCGEWRMLWRQLRASHACGWYWWPMLNVQRAVMNLSMKLRWHRCHCGRAFPPWGHGWLVCPKCREPSRGPMAVTVDDLPF